jgi:fumarate reductase subunit D
VKRSNSPFFWALFGAGGMLAALLGPALVFITGLAAPAGWLLPPDYLSYARVQAFTRAVPGKVFALVVVALFAWHAAHRIFHSLHDLGIRSGVVARLACYGGALLVTVLAAVALR